jgi:transcriptional regulator with XRE-family HTH domain
MAVSRDVDPSSLELFAAELKAVRSKAGLSREELAARINYSGSLIGMIETLRRVPQEDFAKRCDRVLDTPGTFTRMQDHLRADSFPAWFRPFVEYEAIATALRSFEHSMVPGLLQTEDYARAVLATRPGVTEDEVAQRVKVRMDRQAILNRAAPPRLWAVIDEAVLHRQVGSPKVMRDQLLHLVEMSRKPAITIEIVPFGAGAHSGLLGAFIVAEINGTPPIAYLETVLEGQIVEEPSVVAKLMLVFDTLRAEALTRGASRDLIGKVAEERWT